MSDIFRAMQVVARDKGLEGFRTVINTGREGGQTVWHLHVHLMSGRSMSEKM